MGMQARSETTCWRMLRDRWDLGAMRRTLFHVAPLSFDGGPAMRSSYSQGPKVVDLIVHPNWRSVDRRNFQCKIEMW